MKHLPSTALSPNGADYKRRYLHVAVDLTVSLEDILRPGFWAHHAAILTKGDLIDVFGDHLDVQLRVMGKGVGYVEVRPLRIWQSSDIQAIADPVPEELPDVPAGYDVKRGPGGRWRVMVKEPYAEIEKGILTEAQARNLAIAHFNKANAVAA